LDPPSVPCRNPVHKISDIEMPPFRHQARTTQQGHEKHEEDRDLFRKGEREVGQIAHNHIDEGDERQQSEDQARQVFFNTERDPGVGSIHGSGGFTLHGSSFPESAGGFKKSLNTLPRLTSEKEKRASQPRGDARFP